MQIRRVWSATGLTVILLALATHSADARRYQLTPDESQISLHVGKAGALKGLGHEHMISARAFSGYIDLDETALARSRVSLTIDSRSLQVQPGGEPASDVPKIQKTMEGPEVLDTQRFPRITVTSRHATATQVGPGVFDVQLTCDLELHGVVKPINLRLRLETAENRIVARGDTTIRQTAFGIRPVRIAGGTIKVKDDVGGRFVLVGRAPG
jgi:polyisoprenoid-binding protein YceI